MHGAEFFQVRVQQTFHGCFLSAAQPHVTLLRAPSARIPQANSLRLASGNGGCGLDTKAQATIVDLTTSLVQNPIVPTLLAHDVLRRSLAGRVYRRAPKGVVSIST
jgi:hypothetical protein